MQRSNADTYREKFWKQRLAGADTPRKRVYALQNKMLADLERLPPECQDRAREMAAAGLAEILDEIQIKVAEEAWT